MEPSPCLVLPDESPDIRVDIADAFAEPEEWIDAPNPMLGGARPRDLIGTERERQVRDLLRLIKYVGSS